MHACMHTHILTTYIHVYSGEKRFDVDVLMVHTYMHTYTYTHTYIQRRKALPCRCLDGASSLLVALASESVL